MATNSEIERLSVVETKVDRAVQDIATLTTSVDDGFTELNSKLDGLDNKYAAKWVQSAVAFVVGIIIAAFIYALIAIVIPAQNGNRTNQINPSTSTTTTTTTPTGSTSTTRNGGQTGSSTPSAEANATSKSDTATPNASQSQTDNGGVQVTLPKVIP